MGSDTLFTRRARLAAQLGIKRSQTIPSDLQSELNDFVEKAIYYVANAHEWPWLRAYERVELQPRYVSGSITIDSGDLTAVAGTGTAWDGLGLTEMYFGGNEYRVSSITDDTNLVLTDAALAAVSDANYELYKTDYTLSTVFVPETMRVSLTARRPLDRVGVDVMDGLRANRRRSGHPEQWTIIGYSSGKPILRFYPIPYYNEIVHVYGKKSPTIPTADNDTDDFPNEMSHVIDEWAKVFLFEFNSDPRYQMAMMKAQDMLIRAYDQMDGADQFVLDPAVFANPPAFPFAVDEYS